MVLALALTEVMRHVEVPSREAHLAMRSLGVRWRACPARGRLSQGHGEAWWVTAATTARSSAATDSISVLVSVKVYSTALTCATVACCGCSAGRMHSRACYLP